MSRVRCDGDATGDERGDQPDPGGAEMRRRNVITTNGGQSERVPFGRNRVDPLGEIVQLRDPLPSRKRRDPREPLADCAIVFERNSTLRRIHQPGRYEKISQCNRIACNEAASTELFLQHSGEAVKPRLARLNDLGTRLPLPFQRFAGREVLNLLLGRIAPAAAGSAGVAVRGDGSALRGVKAHVVDRNDRVVKLGKGR
jgi:hypothetical protein